MKNYKQRDFWGKLIYDISEIPIEIKFEMVCEILKLISKEQYEDGEKLDKDGMISLAIHCLGELNLLD